ncbi:sporulation protein YunB [Intestinibacillus sp. Marseille-P6563]|uniref:sporulation protein YunB n=1 Tax=Intestinibacillus sp. Marseille-P6563 TaxID=2364792 RepID=UPI0013E04E7C|nr:sporulation protein YunB [Intestinibacillus sp. Marseille-P6563]
MRRINWRAWLILLLLCSLGCTWIFLRLLRPIVLEYAQNLVQQTASYAIHDTLTDVIYQNRAQYEDLVTLERDNENQVTALKTDTILADYLKVQLSRAAYDALNTLEQGGVDIPLGSVFFPTLFAGRGPTIHVGVASLGYADADFISAFTSAGINQTRHQILLEIQADARLMTAMGGCDVSITNRMTVTDTVIVGTVPDSYTYIDDTEQSLLGKINDYAE